MNDETKQLAHAKALQISQDGFDQKITATQIDRRQCQRVRPLEVLCLGLERTGTLSLRTALLHLGYFDVYHMAALMIENPPDGDMWVQAIDAKYNKKGHFGKEDWDQLLGHCMAVTDQPAAMFGEDLIQAYPDAKVVLTVRDSPEAWQKSVMDTIMKLVWTISPQHIREPGKNPLYHLQRLFAPRLPVQEFFEKMIAAHEGDKIPDEGARIYREHNEKIRQAAQPANFLEFNVKQGWEPLCKFLDEPVPDMPFPRVNDTAQYATMLRNIRMLTAFGYTINILKVMFVPAAAAGALYYFR